MLFIVLMRSQTPGFTYAARRPRCILSGAILLPELIGATDLAGAISRAPGLTCSRHSRGGTDVRGQRFKSTRHGPKKAGFYRASGAILGLW